MNQVLQSAGGHSSSGFSLAFPNPTLTGSRLKATLFGGASPLPAVVSDSYGNQWKQLGSPVQIVGAGTEAEFYVDSCVGGANHTVTFTGLSLTAVIREVVALDISPATIASRLDDIHQIVRTHNKRDLDERKV